MDRKREETAGDAAVKDIVRHPAIPAMAFSGLVATWIERITIAVLELCGPEARSVQHLSIGQATVPMLARSIHPSLCGPVTDTECRDRVAGTDNGTTRVRATAQSLRSRLVAYGLECNEDMSYDLEYTPRCTALNDAVTFVMGQVDQYTNNDRTEQPTYGIDQP